MSGPANKANDAVMATLMLKLQQYAAQGCNGSVIVHFAAGQPRKLEYHSTEQISLDNK